MPKPSRSNPDFTPIALRAGLTALALAWMGCGLALAQTPPTAEARSKPAKAAGIEGKVTPEMIGAGMVSSGVTLPPIPPVTGSRTSPVPSWGKPLPFPIVIADRRNNRLLEVAPDKSIVWEFPSPSLKMYRGNEDVNFSADGKLLAVSEEDNYDVHIVDYEKRMVTWTYGTPDTRGSGPGLLNYPDDAHLLADGKFLTADIRNCRVLFIDPATNKVATQWGTPGQCKHNPPSQLAHPNGATPLENGDILVTEISDAWISRITREGKVLWSTKAPNIRYPSDAFPTVDGAQVIVADFWKPGRVVIFDPTTRTITWEYFVKDGDRMLDHPSIARELPGTGDILIVDDLNDRVIVVDRSTKQVIWQYGEKGKKGHAPGLLNYPDGVDLDLFRDWKAALGK
jgi:outer membrane protein assembly factor BamB